MAEMMRSTGVTPFTDLHWRKEFSGLRTGQAKRPKLIVAEAVPWVKRVSEAIQWAASAL